MRFAVSVLAALAASFSLVAAQSATVNPSVAAPKRDVTRTAPPSSNVNVLNFPAVQTVEGTVNVGNLPAVQTVSGAVQVTGQVSVTNLPPTWAEPTFAVLQVLAVPGALDTGCGPCRNWTSGPFNVAGWKVLSAQLVFTDGTNVGAVGAARVAFRNFADDPIGDWQALDDRHTAPVVGAEAEVQTANIADIFTGLHFSIYLSR